jgi:membrane protease YdiL (CAAX protease family)
MTNNRIFLISELILLFFIVPVILFLDVFPVVKVSSVLIALVYTLVISRKKRLIPLKTLTLFPFKKHSKRIFITAVIVLSSSLLFMYYWHPEDLFMVVKRNPLLWISILFFYAIFSVLPQELLYRSYFFTRYNSLFKNTNHLLILNIIVFPIAHLFLKNWLVLLITLIGGILFAISYKKSKSILLTSLEHAIYGNWIFTIGMGEMLAFPMPS